MSVTYKNETKPAARRLEPRGRTRRRTAAADRERRPLRRGGAVRPGTLEELVLATADQLEHAGSAQCPVCGRGELVAAGCGSCGSELS